MWRELDRVLRGDATTRAALGRSGPLVPVGQVALANLLLAALYGVCMGVYGFARSDATDVRPVVAGAAKVPALFALTLLVTFPSLYVFNTLLGSRLRAGELLGLVAAALAVLLAVLAAFGPIVAFFSVTTTSYPFVLLMNLAVFAGAAGIGAGFLYRTLTKLAAVRRPRPAVARPVDAPPVDVPEEGPDREAADADAAREAPVVSRAFSVWMGLFGLVGAQMGWVLRPFVGSPHLPFAWFRPREGSVVEAVTQSVRALVGG